MAKVIVLGEDDDDNETSGNTKENGRTTYHKKCKCKKGTGACGMWFTTFKNSQTICGACIMDIHSH